MIYDVVCEVLAELAVVKDMAMICAETIFRGVLPRPH